eukprot:gene6588-3241_t
MDAPSSSDRRADEEDDVDGVAETELEGRFLRYKDVLGKGRFKQVFKSFDTSRGIDVAWSKISAGSNQLSNEQLEAVAQDIQTGLDLEHPNIIKCFKCWEDRDNHCINLITELFTSGNLRQYRNLHKHLDLKAVKRMARQILKGLEYLHNKQVTHGDLRCDKIYVNGHLGEIKIGDLGLATLMPYRWRNGDGPCPEPPAMDQSGDVFAFGLCLLELLTLKQFDPQHCVDWEGQLDSIADLESITFLSKCLSPERPTAAELSEDVYFTTKKTVAPPDNGSAPSGASEGGSTGGGRQFDFLLSSRSLNEAIANEKRMTDEGIDDSSAPIAVGKLRGEDYNFEFAGKVKEGKMHFRLVMTQVVVDVNEIQPFMRTVDFVFDPDIDTADNLAAEISEEFNLSPTDTEICAAALREWLAKELPEMSEGGK